MDYNKIAKDIRKKILQMHFKAGSSHIASAYSCVDILVALYFGVLRIDPDDPRNPNRDKFILSKGHACSALYTTLVKKGFCSADILEGYCVDSGKLPGHSTIDCLPGVEVSTGSLGHGLSMGIGMAIAAKNDKTDNKIYVLISDGECNEGSVWEAALFAGHHGLDNLVAIIDYNKIQAYERIENVMNLEPFVAKWQAFSWEVKEVAGHNIGEIIEVVKQVPFTPGKPSIVIAHTVKGKGISFMENTIKWHFKSPSESDLEMAMRELDAL